MYVQIKFWRFKDLKDLKFIKNYFWSKICSYLRKKLPWRFCDFGQEWIDIVYQWEEEVRGPAFSILSASFLKLKLQLGFSKPPKRYFFSGPLRPYPPPLELLSGQFFFLGIFLGLQKKFFFLSDQNLNTPFPPPSGRNTKKTFFAASLTEASRFWT